MPGLAAGLVDRVGEGPIRAVGAVAIGGGGPVVRDAGSCGTVGQRCATIEVVGIGIRVGIARLAEAIGFGGSLLGNVRPRIASAPVLAVGLVVGLGEGSCCSSEDATRAREMGCLKEALDDGCCFKDEARASGRRNAEALRKKSKKRAHTENRGAARPRSHWSRPSRLRV